MSLEEIFRCEACLREVAAEWECHCRLEDVFKQFVYLQGVSHQIVDEFGDVSISIDGI